MTPHRSRASFIAIALACAFACPTAASAQSDNEPELDIRVDDDAPVDAEDDPPETVFEEELDPVPREPPFHERPRPVASPTAGVEATEETPASGDAVASDSTRALPADRAEAEPEADERGLTVRPLASVFSRLEVREGYEGLGAPNPGCFPGANDGACMRYRARVGLAIEDLRVSDQLAVEVRFLPQATGFWSLGGSGGVTHPNLGLYEGNLTLRIGSSVSIQGGRLVLNYGDELVIGKLGWHPAARAFDGARLRIQPDSDGAWVDAFFTVLQEGGAGSFGAGDIYFYGAYAALGPAVGLNAFDAYVLGLQANESEDPTTGDELDWSLLLHVGAWLRHRVSVVDMRLEGGLQVGRAGQVVPADAESILAGHVDGEVGVNLLEDRLRIGAHGFFASGDDPSTPKVEGYFQFFPTAHAFLGLTDVMGGRTNVAGRAACLGEAAPEAPREPRSARLRATGSRRGPLRGPGE